MRGAAQDSDGHTFVADNVSLWLKQQFEMQSNTRPACPCHLTLLALAQACPWDRQGFLPIGTRLTTEHSDNRCEKSGR